MEAIISLLDEITEVIKRNYPSYDINSTHADKIRTIRKIFESESKIFLAKYRNQVIGIINLQIVNNIRHGYGRGHLEEMVVKKQYRNKGVGTLLLKKVVDYCRKGNIVSIKAGARKDLKKIRRFFEKNDFRFVDAGYRLEIKQ